MDNINYANVRENLEQYIESVAGDKGVVIGLSGGIDSSVACVLAKNALGPKKIKGIILENSKFSREVGMSTAEQFAMDQGIEIQKVDVQKIRGYILDTLPINPNDTIPIATMDVRLCDLYLRTYASLENKIYLGTINATERLCGWFPKGGLTGDYDLLGGLLKEQIKYLGEEMGLGHLLPTVSQDAKDICSGCGELPEFEGIPYKTLDEVLYIIDTTKSMSRIKEKLKAKDIPEDTFKKIKSRVEETQHKRDVFPDFPKINLSY
jgi:NAD+ synthetase|tara:strand:+ start:875 stop:1666 length:792 start_codon:yes stop_codon:yes gene_type:complete